MKKLTLLCLVVYCSCTNSDPKKTEINKGGNSAPEEKKITEKVARSVKKSDLPTEALLKSTDTLQITQKALVIHDASNKEIEKWRSQNEENFGESVSDNLVYVDETNTNAKKMNLPIIRTEANIIVFNKNDGTKITWVRGKNYEGWGAIAFRENANPLKVEITASDEQLKKYFSN